MPAPIAPLLAQAVALTLAETTELRTRLFEQSVDWDASAQPSAELSMATHRSDVTFGYHPELLLLSIGQPDSELAFYNRGDVRANHRFQRTNVLLQQSGTYGERNFRLALAPELTAPEAPDPGAGAEPAEPGATGSAQARTVDQVVRFWSTTSTAGMAHILSHTHVLSAYASYEASAGIGDESRLFYPLQRKIAGSVRETYAFSRRDSLLTNLDGSRVYTDPDIRSDLATLQEIWMREFRGGFELSIGGGVSYARTATADGTTTVLGLEPAGTLSVGYNWSSGGSRYALEANGTAAPVVDRTTGEVDNRASWTVSLSRVRHQLTLLAAANGTHSLDRDTNSFLSSVGMSLGAIYLISRYWTARAGATGSLQILNTGEKTTPILWTGFIGLAYQPAAIRL